MRSNRRNNRIRFALATAGATVTLLASAAPALATGGVSTPGAAPSGPVNKAKLVKGKAIPPWNAPYRVKKAIWAANRIRTKPYRWGGGHARFNDTGYDCSGAVSYVLHAAGVLSSPLASGPLMRWGTWGWGRWITVFANRRHTYAKIAGLRWDTSGPGQRGPRWRATNRSRRGYVVRHAPGL